ncbi:MAG: carbohydrate kinase family protein [Anaerolineaceae bacterium]|nr:carbohydrate kinase family protein [Anaerolineaceae bacterium]
MIESSLANRSSELPVLVIGAAGMDMVGRLKTLASSAQFLAGKSNPANIRVSFGGVARNVAENLSRLGQPVCLLTAVGKDQSGKEMLAYTAACGVDVSACLRSENFSTSSYLAVYDSEGLRYLALEDMAVLEEITPAYLRLNKHLIAQSTMVFVDSNLSPKALKSVISLARQAGVPVCADTTSALLAQRLIPHLGGLAMISANNAEASVLCQNDPVVTNQETAIQAARKLINNGVELVVIALAEFGVVYATSETSGHIPAVRTRILDPTGAGDALIATVIFGLLNQIPIDESVRLGITAASLILRHPGTVLPNLTLEKLYDGLLV